MDHFPIFLNIKNQRCIVAGEGEVLEQRARALLDAGARVEIWRPESLAENLAENLTEDLATHNPFPKDLDNHKVREREDSDHPKNQGSLDQGNLDQGSLDRESLDMVAGREHLDTHKVAHLDGNLVDGNLVDGNLDSHRKGQDPGEDLAEDLDRHTGAIGLKDSHGSKTVRVGSLDAASLNGAKLLMLCYRDHQENARLAKLADKQGMPVNVAKNERLSTFIVPSIIDRSPLLAAVTTSGASPTLSRLIRARLELLLPLNFGRLATLAKEFKNSVRQSIPGHQLRRRFWERVLDGPIAEMVYAGREVDAREALTSAIEEATAQPDTSRIGAANVGEVYLVGAGPGDPDLLTFRAFRLVQQADVIVYDRLVSREILALARRDAELIYAGKARDRHHMRQEAINHLLVRLARKGQRVLRLKGGDPFTFARGGEELEQLVEEGIPFQIVPGITAATGCAAYAGIPLTHRDYAHAVVFVTGHMSNGAVNLNWPMLAQPDQTIVVYMGLHGVSTICRELEAHGLPGNTPAAMVQQGTMEEQRVLVGCLDSLPEIVEREAPRAPTLTIIGEVVKLRNKLKWFEHSAPVRLNGLASWRRSSVGS